MSANSLTQTASQSAKRCSGPLAWRSAVILKALFQDQLSQSALQLDLQPSRCPRRIGLGAVWHQLRRAQKPREPWLQSDQPEGAGEAGAQSHPRTQPDRRAPACERSARSGARQGRFRPG